MELLNNFGVIGFALAGFLMPEFFSALGSGKRSVPLGQNLYSTISAALIAIYFIYS